MNKIRALLLSGLLLPGCTDQPRTMPAPAESGGPTSAESISPAERRTIEIYSVVLRRLVLKDHTFGRGRSPFRQVYVLDGSVGSGSIMRQMWKIEKPFSDDVRRGLLAELRALPPITFISGAEAKRMGKKGMETGLEGMGVILSVGSIDRHVSRVEVSNSLWCGGLCGQWMTYVLERSEGRWKITGTTGPAAIS